MGRKTVLESQIYLKIFLYYLLLVNTVSFCLFAGDKRRARQGGWRIPERTLFLWAIVGGALGGLLGMYVFRHKTQHIIFKWGFPLIILLQLSFVYYLYR